MNKHPYNSPEAALLLLAKEDLLAGSDENEGGSGTPENPFWQGGEIVFPDIPLG